MYASGNNNNSTRLRVPIDVGLLIKERRRELRLTQAEAAEQAGVGRRFLIELEEGKPTAQLGKTMHVLAMLGIVLSGTANE